MLKSLQDIWCIYCENEFYRNYREKSKISQMLGWESQRKGSNSNNVSYSTVIEKLYKNHMMIKKGSIPGYHNNGCDTYSIYIAEDINDPDPVLIYYCYEHKNAMGTFREGWVNISDWSLIAKKMIDDDTNTIKVYNEQEVFNNYIEKEKQFTQLIKPNLHEFFKNSVKCLDNDIYLSLCNDIINNTELNDYTRQKDREEAEAVANKLIGKD